MSFGGGPSLESYKTYPEAITTSLSDLQLFASYALMTAKSQFHRAGIRKIFKRVSKTHALEIF